MKIDVKGVFKKIKSMWKTPPEGRCLTIKEMGDFGFYALGISFISSSVYYVATISFIPYFYHIDVIHAYLIMILGMVINLLIQPFIGNIMERTNTKFGRYKPFILFSLPLLSLFAVLVTWIPQIGEENMRIIYAYCTCVPFFVLMNFNNNMYQTMPSVITPVSQERADMMTPIGLIFGFAPSVLQIIAGPIRAHFAAKGMEYMGIRIIGIIAVTIGTILVLFILRVKERVYELKDKDKEEKVKFSVAIKMMLKNKPLIILFLALSFGSLREFCRQFIILIIQFRFAETTTQAMQISGVVMTIIGFASTVAMFLLPIVTRKLNKNAIIILFTVSSVVSFGFLGLFGYQNIPIGMPSAVTITILFFLSAINPTYLLIPIMLGEIADFQQHKTGKRLEGHMQSLLFSLPGLISLVLMLVTWFWQRSIGFEPKNYENVIILSEAQQQTATLWFNATSIISAASGFIMIIILCFYPLTKKKYNQIVAELEAKSEKIEKGGESIEPASVSSEQV